MKQRVLVAVFGIPLILAIVLLADWATAVALAFLCVKIEGCEGKATGETPAYVQLGVEFENGMSDGEMVEKIGKFLEKQSVD